MSTMADELYVFLSWMADRSTFYSVLSVIICLVAMVIFIWRLKVDQVFWTLPYTRLPIVPNRKMNKVSNPFVLQFKNLSSKELKDELHVELVSQHPCHISCLWAISINEMHEALAQPAHELLREVEDRTFLKDSTAASLYLHLSATCESEMLTLKCPVNVEELALGPTPRRCYPMVIILSLPLGIPNLDVRESDVVASVYIIHLKDSNCQMKSQILNHYVKLYDGRLLNLQPLYYISSNKTEEETAVNSCAEEMVEKSDGNSSYYSTVIKAEGHSEERPSDPKSKVNPTDSTLERDDNSQTNEVLSSDNECIVCQSSTISTVLLPCRHTCVCEQCFVQLDKCPLCRGNIDSFFSLKESDCVSPVLSSWESLNQTLNNQMRRF